MKPARPNSPSPQEKESNGTRSFVHNKVCRADGMISVDDQLVVIQIPTRLSIHLFINRG